MSSGKPARLLARGFAQPTAFVTLLCRVVVAVALVGSLCGVIPVGMGTPPTVSAAGAWPTPTSASLVGDSLVSAQSQMYADALRGVDVDPRSLSGVSGRALRYGWQCWVNGMLRVWSYPMNTTCKREGLEELRWWADSGLLGDVVVIALGTNDAGMYSRERQWENLAEARKLAGTRPVYLVTVHSTSPSEDVRMMAFNDNARAWCATDPKCAVIDWAGTADAHNRSLYVDTVHLGWEGTSRRARYIAEQVVDLSVQPDRSVLASVAPIGAASTFTAVDPVRVASSVSGMGLSRLVAHERQRVRVAGVHGLPSGVTAVAVNVIVSRQVAPGSVSVYPCVSGADVVSVSWPKASTTVAAGQIVGTVDDEVCVRSNVAADVVLDVSGVFTSGPGQKFNPVTTRRLVDSRDGTGGVARLRAGAVVRVDVGRRGVPEEAGAVALNVTAVDSSGRGTLSVHPCSSPSSLPSVWFGAGVTRGNSVVVSIGTHRGLCLMSTTATDVLVELSGWFGSTGRRFVPVDPTPVLDTDSRNEDLSGGMFGAPLLPWGTVTSRFVGTRGIPARAAAAAMTVSVSAPRQVGFVTVWPSGDPYPDATTLWHGPGVRTNGTLTRLDRDGVDVFAWSGGHVRMDLFGYWV